MNIIIFFSLSYYLTLSEFIVDELLISIGVLKVFKLEKTEFQALKEKKTYDVSYLAKKLTRRFQMIYPRLKFYQNTILKTLQKITDRTSKRCLLSLEDLYDLFLLPIYRSRKASARAKWQYLKIELSVRC